MVCTASDTNVLCTFKQGLWDITVVLVRVGCGAIRYCIMYYVSIMNVLDMHGGSIVNVD